VLYGFLSAPDTSRVPGTRFCASFLPMPPVGIVTVLVAVAYRSRPTVTGATQELESSRKA